MILEIILTILATLLLIIGLFLNGLIISYLKNKDQLHKTGFDQTLIDFIWSNILVILSFYSLTTCIIWSVQGQQFLIGLVVLQGVSNINMASSTLVTILVKHCYIRFSGTMLGTPDRKIYGWSLIGRLVIVALVIFFNWAKPFPDLHPIELMVLDENPNEPIQR